MTTTTRARDSETSVACDCRRPAPDLSTIITRIDVIQCRGCRGWITGRRIFENPWGLTVAERDALFGAPRPRRNAA